MRHTLLRLVRSILKIILMIMNNGCGDDNGVNCGSDVEEEMVAIVRADS